MKKILIFLITIMLPVLASADAVEIDGIYYNLISKAKQAEVTSAPNKYSGTIIIPESVTYEGEKYEVTSIKEKTFYDCTTLVSVTIPNTVICIGAKAFEDSGVESITIPNSVTSIGDAVFRNCKNLISIIVPDNLTTIGKYWFEGCSNLTSFTIPTSVTFIGFCAFQGCSSLTTIEIPSSVGCIAELVFYGCVKLENIIISNGITRIGHGAFSYCNSLKSVEIPSSVRQIDPEAFYKCKSLTSVTIHNCNTIGKKVFYGCTNLSTIRIGNGVESISEQAFAECPNLSDIYCYAEKIPNTENDIFEGSYIEYATLHVLFSLIDSYKATDPWKNFGTIKVAFCPAEENIEMQDVKMMSGETAPITLKLLESITGCVGIQFDLVLPDGFSLEKDNTGKEYVISANQASDITCNLTAVSNNVYRFMLYSNSLKEFIPDELMNINLKVSEEKPLETYSVSVQDVQLSDISGNVHNDNGASANVKVTKFFKLLYQVDGVDYKSFDVEYETTITPEPEPTKEGYAFSGWSEIPKTMPAHDVTVTGTFSINKYKLTYVVDGEVYKTYEIEYGATITPEPEPTKEGYTFSGWSEIPAMMPAYDVTITGTFSINKYKLTYTVDSEVYKTYDIEFGATITPEPAPTKEGYIFSGWSEIPETMPAHDVTVIGTFSINSYKLTYTVDGEVYKTYKMEYGATITPEAEPTKEGYTFSGWSEIPATMPAHDVTVTGTFSINKYKLTYVVDGVEYKSYDIEYGATITPEAEPTKEGYTFSGWSTIPTTMPAYDVTITGSFTKGAYKLTYMLDGVVYKTISYDYGDAITPEPAPTKEGYTFSGWSEIPETMPAHDVTITGTFSINKYKLTYVVDGIEYKLYDIEYGATITPEAEPAKEGYTFSGWSTIPATMPAYDVTVTGTFKVNKYKVNYFVDNNPYYTDMVEYGAIITPPNVPEREGYDFAWVYIPDTMPAYDISIYGQYTIKTGIKQIMRNANGDVMIFTIDGKRVDNLKKGMNVIRMSDGTTRKVVVK